MGPGSGAQLDTFPLQETEGLLQETRAPQRARLAQGMLGALRAAAQRAARQAAGALEVPIDLITLIRAMTNQDENAPYPSYALVR